MSNILPPPGMSSQQFLQLFKSWFESQERRKEYARQARYLKGEKLGWVIKGDIDKFSSVEDAVRHLKVFEELSSTERGREKLSKYISKFEEE